ncbi:DUF2156 domain-containing protein [Desulfonema magnum]|uniref:DUF2156 n=1 Tax=Desulfonema magnum TaxID=45655 RepID=A0A975BM73_9BACT|nr:phosphatidylglycerol lysyltransferase domain-containing protein [Desulfonema magnum]QTA87580.1 DUF2156 [Desulfonema magnum]
MKSEPLTPSDYTRLENFFQQQKYELCAYSLSSILVWSTKVYQPVGITDGETLIIGVEFDATHEDKNHLILPVSPVREYSPEELHDLAVNLGFERFWFVPGDYIERYGQNQLDAFFETEEQPELDDYVYLTENLAELKGNKYSKKRNLISQFKKEYRDRILIEKITSSAMSECVDFLEEWCEERDCEADPETDLACEKQAAKNALEYIDILGMNGILLRVDGVVSAFGIMSRLTENMGVLHFEKAFSHIKGLYQFFDRACARTLFNGCKYINKESDMGIPGLAKAKQSYYPVKMMKSYKLTISPAGSPQS